MPRRLSKKVRRGKRLRKSKKLSGGAAAPGAGPRRMHAMVALPAPIPRVPDLTPAAAVPDPNFITQHNNNYKQNLRNEERRYKAAMAREKIVNNNNKTYWNAVKNYYINQVIQDRGAIIIRTLGGDTIGPLSRIIDRKKLENLTNKELYSALEKSKEFTNKQPLLTKKKGVFRGREVYLRLDYYDDRREEDRMVPRDENFDDDLSRQGFIAFYASDKAGTPL
jgi:hypothetical protein